MSKIAFNPDASSSVLKPKTFLGVRMEYTLNGDYIMITDSNQPDLWKRRLEIPQGLLGSFINELQEIEKILSQKH